MRYGTDPTYVKAVRLKKSGTEFGERRGNELLRERKEKIRIAMTPPVDEAKAVVMRIGTQVEMWLRDGFTLEELAAHPLGNSAAHALNDAINERVGENLMIDEVEGLYGFHDHFFDEGEEFVPNADGYAYIFGRMLKSALWWSRLTPNERAQFRTDDPTELPHHWWLREVDFAEEGEA